MILHAHLALERREHRLDHEADARLVDLRRRALAEPVPCGHDELDADQLEALVMLTTAVTGVGEEQAAGVRAGEGKDALTLILIGRPQVIAQQGATAVNE